MGVAKFLQSFRITNCIYFGCPAHELLLSGMLENLYGKHAAALYAQAADFNKTARFYYMKAEDAYYLANAQASYDDWRRARRQWDYFYRYEFSSCLSSFLYSYFLLFIYSRK
jgi:hypothetical protein